MLSNLCELHFPQMSKNENKCPPKKSIFDSLFTISLFLIEIDLNHLTKLIVEFSIFFYFLRYTAHSSGQPLARWWWYALNFERFILESQMFKYSIFLSVQMTNVDYFRFKSKSPFESLYNIWQNSESLKYA